MDKNLENALQDLLLDDNKLNLISAKAEELNVFNVLGITKAEIRHSRLIAWLLDPSENHGLEDAFLREAIKKVIHNSLDNDTTRFTGTSFDWLLTEFKNVVINREDKINTGKRVDIIITAEGNGHKFLLAIENKVDSTESKNQTRDYYNSLCNKYVDYDKKMFVFLTPNGYEAEDEHWCTLSYEDIVAAIELAKFGKNLPQKSEMIIDDYVKAVKNEILGDENLIKLSDEIYDSHRVAIDTLLKKSSKKDDPALIELKTNICRKYNAAIELLKESRNDSGNVVAKCIRTAIWSFKDTEIGENLIVDEKLINKKAYIRLNSEKLTQILGGDLDEPLSPWKSKQTYYYEFDNRQDKATFYLVLGGGEYLDTNVNVKAKHLAIAKEFGARPNPDYLYKRVAVCDNNSIDLPKAKLSKDDENAIIDFANRMISNIPTIEGRISKAIDNM